MNTPAPEYPMDRWNPLETEVRPDQVHRPMPRNRYSNSYQIPKETNLARVSASDSDEDFAKLLNRIDLKIAEKKAREQQEARDFIESIKRKTAAANGKVVTAFGAVLPTGGIFSDTNQTQALVPGTPEPIQEKKAPYSREASHRMVLSNLNNIITDSLAFAKRATAVDGYHYSYEGLHAEYRKILSLQAAGILTEQDVLNIQNAVDQRLKFAGVCEYARDILMPWNVENVPPSKFFTQISSFKDDLPGIFSENPETPSQANALNRTHAQPLAREPLTPEAARAPVVPRTTEAPFSASQTIPAGITVLRDFTMETGPQEHAAVNIPVSGPPPVPSVQEHEVLILGASATNPEAIVAAAVPQITNELEWYDLTPEQLLAQAEYVEALTTSAAYNKPEAQTPAEETEVDTTPLTPTAPIELRRHTALERAKPRSAYHQHVQRFVEKYGRAAMIASMLGGSINASDTPQTANPPLGAEMNFISPAMKEVSENLPVTFSKAAKKGAPSFFENLAKQAKSLFVKQQPVQELTDYEKKYLATHQSRVDSAREKAAQWQAGNRVQEFEMVTPITNHELKMLDRTEATVLGETTVNRLYAKKDVMISMGENVNPAINLYKTPTSAAKEQPKSLFGKLGSKVKSWFA